MADSMSRFARSWLLIKASMDVLRNDNALLVLPAISSVVTLARRRRLRCAGDVERDVCRDARDAPARFRAARVLRLDVLSLRRAVFRRHLLQHRADRLRHCVARRRTSDGLGWAEARREPHRRHSRLCDYFGDGRCTPASRCRKARLCRAAHRRRAWARLDGGDVPRRADPCRRRRRADASGRTLKRAVAQNLGRELDRQCRHFAGDVDDLRRPSRSLVLAAGSSCSSAATRYSVLRSFPPRPPLSFWWCWSVPRSPRSIPRRCTGMPPAANRRWISTAI